MNGFEQHGITHLSPSSINLWINAPDRWIVEKLFKRRGETSPAQYRGQVIEKAVLQVLRGRDVESEADISEKAFDELFGVGTDRTRKERETIRPTIELAARALDGFGPPIDTGDDQIRVEKTADLGEAGTIKFIGYLDYCWPHTVVDLKTTARILSTMPIEHQRQRAFYETAAARPCGFLYVSPKRSEMLADGDKNKLLAEMKWHAARLERLLRDRTPEEVAAIVPVNLSSFYWRGSEEDAYEIFGIPRIA